MKRSRVSTIVYFLMDTASINKSRVSAIVYIFPRHSECRQELGEQHFMFPSYTDSVDSNRVKVNIPGPDVMEAASYPYPHPNIPVRDLANPLR